MFFVCSVLMLLSLVQFAEQGKNPDSALRLWLVKHQLQSLFYGEEKQPCVSLETTVSISNQNFDIYFGSDKNCIDFG